jgi:preprotein translocase subunit SecG
MRYFFLMLVFLLVCFGLTFSVLMSPASSEKLNLVTLVGSSSTGEVAGSEVQVFGSLEVSHAANHASYQWDCDQSGG